MAPQLGPQHAKDDTRKHQETLSGASAMHENRLAAGAPPRTPLGELTALPQTQNSSGS